MKRLIAAALFALATLTAQAQIRAVHMWIDGRFDLEIDLGEAGSIVVSDDGRIVKVWPRSRDVEMYDDTVFERDYNRGKPSSIGGLSMEYHDDFGSAGRLNAGKLVRVGDIRLSYSDGFMSSEKERAGLIESVGSLKIEYYDNFGSAGRYKAGKPKKIAGVEFDYYVADERGVGHKTSGKELAGLLKSAGGNSYGYDQRRRYVDHPYDRFPFLYLTVTGRTSFSLQGVDVLVRDYD